MQQEDDLRGLAKVMEFMRAISIIFIVVHIYWFCYQAIVDMVRHHILGSVVPRHKGSQESEDDLAEDLCDLPRRYCPLLYELVVARPSVLANREYGNLHHYDNCRIYPSAYVGSMD